jgi:hypothetical protein
MHTAVALSAFTISSSVRDRPMVRSLAFLFLGFVVVWDLASSGPENAAVTRASKAAYEWARDQIERHDLADRTRMLLDDLARALEEAQLPEVAAAPVPEPVSVEPLPDIGVLTANIPTPVSAAAAEPEVEQITIGDSVFAKEAILSFIAEASERTGVSAAYLEALALRESSFNPVAASDHSTARGLYQFIESTWLETFARHGQAHGQGDLAALVTVSADGRPSVSNGRMRGRILDLRFDPKLSTFLAARLAADNRAGLEAKLGRPVSDAELYIAHFLGLSGAETLIEAKDASPRADAAELFPWAARSNRSYFYDGRRHKTVAELYDALLLQAGDIGEAGRLQTAGL